MTTNYTPEETEKLDKIYTELGTSGLSTIASALGKTESSVRSKLVSMDKWVSIGKTSQRKRKSKKELVSEIEIILDFNCTGLMPGNRDTLENLLHYLTE
jgi:hypothetical protein